MKFNLEIDLDRKDEKGIELMQEDLLRNTVKYVYSKSPFYRKAFKEKNITPQDIEKMADIVHLPITTKEDIQQNNWSFLCVRKEMIAEVVSTSGTTGSPIFLAMTKGDIERLAENERRSFFHAGIRSDDLIQIAVTLDNLFIAGMAYYEGLLRLGAGVVRVGPCSPQRQVELLQLLKPTGIVSIPSFLLRIYEYADSMAINLENFGLRKAFLIGESIRDLHGSLNTLGKMLVTTHKNIKCVSTYGITEIAVAFCECLHHQGLHSHPDLVFAEILDDCGNPVAEGEIGELVLTSFKVQGMPLLRYRTGDVTRALKGKCSCGRVTQRIGPILGRKAQKLKVKGTTIYPKTIENALTGLEGVENYLIEAYTGEDRADHVIVRVGSSAPTSLLKKTILDRIKTKARVTPEVEVVSKEAIEKIAFKNGNRKPQRFIDRRQKN